MCVREDRREEEEEEERRRRSGYRTKNKNPTRQCGEKQKLKPVVARNASHISHGGQ